MTTPGDREVNRDADRDAELKFDAFLRGVTVERFRATLLDAADALDVVQPPALREPLDLWLRASEERTRRERWRFLLGESGVAVWNAARAILATRGSES